jgi:Protein of unknown function (DUF1222).
MDSARQKPSFLLARWLFLRLVALSYLSGFLSLSVQMHGLYGADGILPIALLLRGAGSQPLVQNMLNAPTIFWLDTSDASISAVPLIGAITSTLACLGIFTGPNLLVSWFLYLSVITVGQDFMSFQWDILLNETGFLALFLCSWRPFCRVWNKQAQRWKLPAWTVDRDSPSLFVLWLYRFLLFKLMFGSGLVKLKSEDPTWWDLTAMTYHYETQPLPTPLGYFAHHLPHWLLMCSTVGVFFIELVVPFAVFAPRKIRIFAAGFLIILQVLILLTGNYCFFNWLTIALCLLLIDDRALKHAGEKFLPKQLSSRLNSCMEYAFDFGKELLPRTAGNTIRWRQFLVIPVLCSVLLLSTGSLCGQLVGDFPSPLEELVWLVHPWRLAGSYGLFAVMTTSRPEIVVEGSLDGVEWKEYVFKYKPGPLNRPPPVVAPHQPRLDWQMWFAALSEGPHDQWFFRLAQKLLEGSTSVSELLEYNPFEGTPPKYIRAQLYDYHFTSIGQLFQSGQWWTRKFKRDFLPRVSLQGGSQD